MTYRLANPSGKTAAEKRGGWRGSGWINKTNRLAIYLRDNFECAYCGSNLREYNPNNITLNHLVCRSRGGSDHFTNLVTACRKCNQGRMTKPFREYAAPGAVDRIMRQRRRSMERFVQMAKALMSGKAKNDALEIQR